MPTVLARFDGLEEAIDRGGFGALESEFGNLPLKQLGYHASVLGLAVRTTILQTYFNPFDEAIEATYIFPIEGQSAVVGCEMRVAERVIRAKLKERGQARADYQRAIKSGYRAALLEENRPETFSMRVGNIPPGEAVQVCIETVSQLAVVNGEWTLRMPLVVAPRFTSGLPLPRDAAGLGTAIDTDQVPDASTVTPPTWLPGFASPVDLRLSVDLRMGHVSGYVNWVDCLKSSLHSIVLEEKINKGQDSSNSECRIQVQPGNRVDRDFVLRGNIDDSRIKTTLTAECPAAGTSDSETDEAETITFAIDIVPPRVHSQVPRDVVFLLDRSGSMSGWKMSAARRGISRLVESMQSNDRFRVIAFDDRVESFSGPRRKPRTEETWHNATDVNKHLAAQWLSEIESRGGTEMGQAIERGLVAFASDATLQGRNLAMVLVTDGQVTGEDSLLRSIASISETTRPRLFCLGIDSAVNGSVLQRLSKFTGGTFELVESEKRLDEMLHRFANEIGSPAITNLRIESTSTAKIRLAPTNIRTLYSGRSQTIFGQSDGSDILTIKVSGDLPNGKSWSQQVAAQPFDSQSFLLPLWGKAAIREMEDELVSLGNRDPELIRQIIDCSLQCNILSRSTAFVAVDETEKVTLGKSPHSIVQPSEFPEGWNMHMPAITREQLMPYPKAFVALTAPIVSAKVRTETVKAFTDRLLDVGTISREQLQDAEALSNQKGDTVPNALVKLGYASNEEVARAAAHVSGLPYIDVSSLQIDSSIIQLIPESVARENAVFPIAQSGNAITILVSDPSDLDTLEKMRFILNRNIIPMVGSADAIRDAINHYYGQIDGESADSMLQEFTDTQIDFTETEEDNFGPADLIELDNVRGATGTFAPLSTRETIDGDAICYQAEPMFYEQPIAKRSPQRRRNANDVSSHLMNAPIVRLVQLMLQEAVQLRASHILLIPSDDKVTIAYVIDGVLVERDSPPRRLLGAIIIRLKLLARLDIADRVHFQSGSVSMLIGEKELELSVHVIGYDVLINMSSDSGRESTPAVVTEWWKTHQPPSHG